MDTVGDAYIVAGMLPADEVSVPDAEAEASRVCVCLLQVKKTISSARAFAVCESSHGHMYALLSCTLAGRGSHPHPPRLVIDPFRSSLP